MMEVLRLYYGRHSPRRNDHGDPILYLGGHNICTVNQYFVCAICFATFMIEDDIPKYNEVQLFVTFENYLHFLFPSNSGVGKVTKLNDSKRIALQKYHI